MVCVYMYVQLFIFMVNIVNIFEMYFAALFFLL